ncbi:MAG TPA: undecaprenyl-diphosphatase UppP [Anaerolineaceae bacterium]|nr:undecaprenyl-diphosphatase UppP [Anaerolineaceae bacterium]
MTFLQSLLLGLIQGLTEFLPISSSAHLVLIPYLLGWVIPEEQIFPFDVLVQLGTLAAVVIYFWKDLWAILSAWVRGLIQRKPFADPQARLGWYLILATIPAGVLAVLIKKQVEAAFQSPQITALFLLGTAVLLLLAEWLGKQTRTLDSLTWKDALWVGAFQAIALFPGISRSGSTITGGMTRHFDRRAAARFSFLMAVPVMFGAGAASIPDLLDVPNLSEFLPVLLAGTLTAGVVGYLSIHWLLSFISKHSLKVFAIYCAALGALVLLLSAFSPVAAVTPEAGAATPTAPVITGLRVQSTAAISWLQPAFNQCAAQQPELGVLLAELPASGLSLETSDLALRWGAPAQSDAVTFLLGEEELVVVVNPSNPLGSLTRAQFSLIFSGTAHEWPELINLTDCPTCPSGEIHLWNYPEGADTQDALESLLPAAQGVRRTYTLIAPDPQRLRESIAADPAGIGVLPRRWVDESVKVVELPEIAAEELRFPILALSTVEPQGAIRTWLGCVEKSISN